MPEGTHESKKPAADVDTLVAGSSPDAAVLAGRSPLPSQLAGPSSSAYVNKGPACEANPELARDPAVCFLDTGTRTRLITQFQLRVMNASRNFQAACGKLDLDQRLASKHEDIPWYVGLMLDVLGSFTGNTLSKAMNQLRSGGLDKLARVGAEILVQKADRPNWATISFNALSAVDSKQISDNLRNVVNAVKKEGIEAARSAGSALVLLPDQEAAGATKHPFLPILEARVDASYQRLWEETPAIASDAELLAIFEAFAAPRHTVAAYSAAIVEKLERFKKSGVSKLGLRIMDRRDPDDRHLARTDARLRERVSPEQVRHGPPGGGMREKKLVWVVYGSGAPGHYGYAHRDWGPSTSITAPIEQSLRPEETTTEVPYYGGPVPAEFVELALHRHRDVWSAAPERFVIFEHQFPFWYLSEPERIAGSRREYEKHVAGVRRLLGGEGIQRDAQKVQATGAAKSDAAPGPSAQPEPPMKPRTDEMDWDTLRDVCEIAEQHHEQDGSR